MVPVSPGRMNYDEDNDPLVQGETRHRRAAFGIEISRPRRTIMPLTLKSPAFGRGACQFPGGIREMVRICHRRWSGRDYLRIAANSR